MLSFNPSKPAKYPNGRVFTDDVIDYRLAFLTKGDMPADRAQAAHRHSRASSRTWARRTDRAERETDDTYPASRVAEFTVGESVELRRLGAACA